MRTQRGRSAPLRPATAELQLVDSRAELAVELDLGSQPGAQLVVDIWSFVEVEPDRHLGWWQFAPAVESARASVKLDFSTIREDSVRLTLAERDVPVESSWVNRDYVFEPINHIKLVVRDGRGQIVDEQHVRLRATDAVTLNRYAQFVYRTSAYVPPNRPQSFVQVFHAERLRQIGAFLSEHVAPGSRILDVASGHSLFTEPVFQKRLAEEWNYRVTCCDLAVDVIEERGRSFPQHGWLICDVTTLPFPDDNFDAVLAGEIIEHVPATDDALREWSRVLRPGGTLLITTPNRRRLVNTLMSFDYPLAPDHINEMSYHECLAAIRRNGLRLVQHHALYVELFTNWFWRGANKFDYLRTEYDWPRLQPLMRLLMRVGNWMKPIAWNLMFVCRK
jgi:ubiquinone/menaquinone biosynthesis C-methylase UbiE